MDHDPQAHRQSQGKPNQIARGLVYGGKGFALGAANAHRHGHERTDKQRSKNNGQYLQAHRDRRHWCPGSKWIELRGFGAHALNLVLAVRTSRATQVPLSWSPGFDRMANFCNLPVNTLSCSFAPSSCRRSIQTWTVWAWLSTIL